MTKQYQVYYITRNDFNENIMGKNYSNFNSLKQAISSAKQLLKETNTLEVLVYDTHLDIPILHPVFKDNKQELINNAYAFQYKMFWQEKLEDII